jgi:preflagellin peptidase FlaK
MHEPKVNGHEVKLKHVFGGVEPTEEVLCCLEELERKNRIKKVWITPEIPFQVYLAAGFFTAAFYGDFLFALLSWL